MKQKIFLFVILLTLLVELPLAGPVEETEECTVMIAGKKTTTDGSILFAKTEDDRPLNVDYLWYIPRKVHEPGSVIKLEAGGTIPNVKETYAYFWDQCPGTSYSNFIVNEWGVAFGSNGCSSKENSLKEVEARGDLVNGGLGFKLRMILAERAKTAREAVSLAAKLLDKYGYNGLGRNLNIVGPNEAWQLQMVRGKIYVARRVQDDEVVIIANTFSIRDVDMKDKKNFICSPNLISYAIKRGWYDPDKDGKFNFASVYALGWAHKGTSNTNRQWIMARLLKKDFPIPVEESQKGIMPVAVKPDRKLSLKDLMAICRNHYEGTPLDKSGFTQNKEYQTTPHKNDSTICNYGTHRTTVIQLRSWLPPAIGTVIWRALDKPCSSVFVPWYLGATRIPQELHNAPESLYTTQRDLLDFHFKPPAETWDPDLESASGIFTHLGQMVDANYNKVITYVKKEWEKFENKAFSLQPVIESSAYELYKKDQKLACEYLTLYSTAQAYNSLEIAKNILKTIKKYLWKGYNKIRTTIEVDPTIYDRFLGKYKSSRGQVYAIVKKQDRLYIKDTNGSYFELLPETEKFYFMKDEDIQVSFIEDEIANITKIIIHLRGRDIEAKKVDN